MVAKQLHCDRYSDEAFWNVVSRLLEMKTGLGPTSEWSKSMINSFLNNFLLELEERCKNNRSKAMLCGVPVIKNEILVDSLTLSYDSFRRIFLTKESTGSKTSKNMFAIYLGYNNYTDLWVKEMIKYPVQFDISMYSNPDELFQDKVTYKLSQYFEYAIFSMLGLALTPKKSLIEVLSEKHQLDLKLFRLLEALYFFNRKEWYLSSDLFNHSNNLFRNYYQFYFLTGVSFYKIKYGGYGAKNSEVYLEKAVKLLNDEVPKAIKSSIFTFYGAILLKNNKLDKSVLYLELASTLAETNTEISKINYYKCIYAAKIDDVNRVKILTDFLRRTSGKYYAITMEYLKLNARKIYEIIKYDGNYEVAVLSS